MSLTSESAKSSYTKYDDSFSLRVKYERRFAEKNDMARRKIY